MAKKKARSYGPNTALIQGARDVAQSEALMSMAGGAAFAQTLTSGIQAGIEEQEKRNAKMDAHLDNLGGIENISLLEEDYNKQAITDFLRNGRDEYSKLAASYEKTKDRATLDKMDAIKFGFNNLNTQLQNLAKEKTDYLSSYDKGQLVTLGDGDEKYTDMYTNNSQFSVDASGNIGFGSGNEYVKFKDAAGKWNMENNVHKTFTLATNLQQTKAGSAGKDFIRDNVKNSYLANLNETGPEGIKVMGVTDMSGDGKYVIGKDDSGNDIIADDMSFKAMWSTGFMDEKFYQKIPKDTDPKWMLDDNNVNHLADLISEYNTDVTQFLHSKQKTKYDAKQRLQQGRQGKAANYIIGGQFVNAQDFTANYVPFVKKLSSIKDNEVIPSPTQVKFTKKDGKYYRVSGMKEGKPILDQDQGAMDLQQLGNFDGWGKFFKFTDNTEKTTSGGAKLLDE